MEQVREAEASSPANATAPVLSRPTVGVTGIKAEGITGPELIAFVNQDEAVRLMGREGQGCSLI